MNPTQNRPATGELSPAVVLRGAARYLQSHGWTQGTYYPNGSTSPFPPACLVGAISMAVHGRRTASPFITDGHISNACVDAVGVFIDYLHRTGQIPAFALVDDFEDDPAPFDFNDAPGRFALDNLQVVPEPGSMLLCGLGSAGLACLGLLRRQAVGR